MKASTWAALALCAGRAVQSKAAAGGDQCDVVCGAIKSEASSSEACAKARKSLPRPKIGRICQEAFEKALELTCAEACQRHGTGRVPESHHDKACDRRRREVPRPVAHKACVEGFNAGFVATTAFIAERVELVPKMDEEAKAALLERHAIILEEVVAELDYSDDRTEETEQGKEGQEGEPQVKTAPTLTTFSRASKAQNVDVSKLGEATQGVSAGDLQTAASMDGVTARGVDKRGAGEQLRDGSDMVDNSAGSSKGESTMIKLGSEYLEVLTAEHVRGFQGASRGKIIDNRAGDESAIVPGAADETQKEGEGVSSEDNLVIKLPNDGRFQEILTVDHVKAFRKTSSRDKPRSDPEGVNSEDNLVMELPKDGRFQEVLTADHVKGFHQRSSHDKPQSDPEGVSSEENLAIELPKDGRFQEVLTADHVKGFHKRSSHDKPRSDPEGASSEDNLVMQLPKDGRFQEILTADNVKGFHKPSTRSRDKPRSDHDRSIHAGGAGQRETIPVSGVAELKDFVVLGEPEPPLSKNEQNVQSLSEKEGQPYEMQGDEVAAFESEGSN